MLNVNVNIIVSSWDHLQSKNIETKNTFISTQCWFNLVSTWSSVLVSYKYRYTMIYGLIGLMYFYTMIYGLIGLMY